MNNISRNPKVLFPHTIPWSFFQSGASPEVSNAVIIHLLSDDAASAFTLWSSSFALNFFSSSSSSNSSQTSGLFHNVLFIVLLLPILSGLELTAKIVERDDDRLLKMLWLPSVGGGGTKKIRNVLLLFFLCHGL